MMVESLAGIFRMSREEVEREFVPYFYRYFEALFSRASARKMYTDMCRHIFDTVQGADKEILDVGCGFGLISLHLASFGAKMVCAVDANAEKHQVLTGIIGRLDSPLDNIEAKPGDATCLDYDSDRFDAVVANEVISHLRDLDASLDEMRRVLRPGGVLYISDGNNSLDILGRRRRRAFWHGREHGPIDSASIRGTEEALPWRLVRKKMIQRAHPEMAGESLDLLAKETAGLYGEEIDRAVRVYISEGKIPAQPDFPFRDPVTGEYNEFEFNPYRLKRKLEKSGFSARVVRPYFARSPGISPGAVLRNLAVWAIRFFYPLSLPVAPKFTILAIKR